MIEELKNIATKFRRSIAFLPSMIALAITLLGVVALFFDYLLIEYFEITTLFSVSSTRAMLTTVTGGTISLLVFSFSTLMVVFTMNSSNLSPRVIPGIIEERTFQIILGLYIGTIALGFICIATIDSNFITNGTPVVSAIISFILLFVCLYYFILFIQTISKNVQTTHIIENLYARTHEKIDSMNELEEGLELRNQDLKTYVAKRSGFYDKILTTKLDFKSHGILYISCKPGDYVNIGDPIFKTNIDLNDEEVDMLDESLMFDSIELISRDWFFGIKHLKEIALKALSPGINDPETAIHAIRRISTLIKKGKGIPKHSLEIQSWGKLIYRQNTAEEMFKNLVAQLTHYAGDPLVDDAIEKLEISYNSPTMH